MRKFLSAAALIALAACGPKKAADTPAADSAATMAPAPAATDSASMAAPAPADTMARDTAKKM